MITMDEQQCDEIQWPGIPMIHFKVFLTENAVYNCEVVREEDGSFSLVKCMGYKAQVRQIEMNYVEIIRPHHQPMYLRISEAVQWLEGVNV